jgi:hypothetical protein
MPLRVQGGGKPQLVVLFRGFFEESRIISPSGLTQEWTAVQIPGPYILLDFSRHEHSGAAIEIIKVKHLDCPVK